MTTTADVVFVFPPAYQNVGAFTNHLGVSYLRAALAQQHISTAQYLNPDPGTVDAVARDIVRRKPAVVGFTVYDTNFPLSVAIARSLKRQRRGIRVVFGGPTPTFSAREILQCQPAVDACVVGEAEETGGRIFASLLAFGALEDPPPGLAVRVGGEVVGTALPPLAGCGTSTPNPGRAALDVLPSPYLTGMLRDGRHGVLTGRGCTHHCQYCCFAALGRRKLRLHSIERVLAELECIADLQRQTGERPVVSIHDDAFTLVPTRAKSLCQAIIDRQLGLSLSCMTRADTVDEELLRMMRDAGFVSLAFGLESAVPSVLRATGKVRPPGCDDNDLEPERQFVERVRQSVHTARSLGLNVGISIVLGLPTETLEAGKATLRFVKSLPVQFYMHNYLWVYPGTPLWDTHGRYGIECSTDSTGLAATTRYAYNLERVRPLRRCSLEQDARIIRTFAADALEGCAAPVARKGRTAIAVVRSGELNGETAAWLASVLDVGGTLLHLYPEKCALRRLQVADDRQTFSDRLVPARHYIQALPRPGEGKTATWTISCSGIEVYALHKPGLVSLSISENARPFKDWLAGRPTDCALCDVSYLVRAPRRLNRFLQATPAGQLPTRLRRMPPAPRIAYPGRWLHTGACCRSLSRIEIDHEGFIRPCRHGEPIGSVGEERRLLQRRLSQSAADAEARRGCAACALPACPRCPFPGMDDRTYCSVMKAQRPALELLDWVQAYSRIPSLLAIERDRVAAD